MRQHKWHVCGAHDHIVGGLKGVREGIGVIWEMVDKLLLKALSNVHFQGRRQASEEVPRLLDGRDAVPGNKVVGDEEVLAIVFT